MSDDNGTGPVLPTPPPKPDPLVGVEDPWEFLRILKEQVPKSERAQYLEPWFRLVLKQNSFEIENLGKAGKDVFGYTIGLYRDRVKELKKEQTDSQVDICASFVDGPIVGEMVYRPQDRKTPVGFLLYNTDQPDQPPQFATKYEIEDRSYFPLNARMARDGTVRLPDKVEEYGTEEALFNDLRHYLGTFVQWDKPGTKLMAAAYILMSWMADTFYSLPYFRVLGDFGVGKSRTIKVVGLACYRPTLASGALTSAALFRIADQVHGTFVIDEADFTQTDMEADITKILNGGFEKDFRIYRTESDDAGQRSVRGYDVYGPKVLATRRAFKDAALESRCFSHSLPLLNVDPRIPIFLDKEFEVAVQSLRNKLLLWRFRQYGRLSINSRSRIADLEPRLNQIILPMLAVVKFNPVLGDEMMTIAREHSKTTETNRQTSLEGKIVETVLKAWSMRHPSTERISLKSVVDRLQQDDDIRALEITGHRIGTILSRTLGVKTTYRGGTTWLTLTPSQIQRLTDTYKVEAEEGPAKLMEAAKAVELPKAPETPMLTS